MIAPILTCSLGVEGLSTVGSTPTANQTIIGSVTRASGLHTYGTLAPHAVGRTRCVPREKTRLGVVLLSNSAKILGGDRELDDITLNGDRTVSRFLSRPAARCGCEYWFLGAVPVRFSRRRGDCLRRARKAP